MISGKELYLHRKRNLDRKYGVNYCKYKPKVFSPYEGFDKDAVLERDNFTCQWCGYTPIKEEITSEKMNEWLLWRDPGFLCMYIKPRVRRCWLSGSEVSVDRYCGIYCKRDHPKTYEKCNEPIELQKVSTEELKRYAWRKMNAHHLDENTRNNNLSNLITLCHSCHMLYHARRKKGYTLKEAQLEVKNIKELKK